jgi:hypothetical protein
MAIDGPISTGKTLLQCPVCSQYFHVLGVFEETRCANMSKIRTFDWSFEGIERGVDRETHAWLGAKPLGHLFLAALMALVRAECPSLAFSPTSLALSPSTTAPLRLDVIRTFEHQKKEKKELKYIHHGRRLGDGSAATERILLPRGAAGSTGRPGR